MKPVSLVQLLQSDMLRTPLEDRSLVNGCLSNYSQISAGGKGEESTFILEANNHQPG
jgi:hypothetical protein